MLGDKDACCGCGGYEEQGVVEAGQAAAPISCSRSARSCLMSASLGSPATQSPPEHGAQKVDGLYLESLAPQVEQLLLAG